MAREWLRKAWRVLPREGERRRSAQEESDLQKGGGPGQGRAGGRRDGQQGGRPRAPQRQRRVMIAVFLSLPSQSSEPGAAAGAGWVRSGAEGSWHGLATGGLALLVSQ